MTDEERRGREALMQMLRADLPLMSIMGAFTECMKRYGSDEEKQVGVAVDHMVGIMFPLGGRKKQ